MTDLIFILPEAFNWTVEHWEMIGGLFVAAALVVAAVAYFRSGYSKAIHETQADNISALEKLLQTRDQTIADLRAAVATEIELHNQTKIELEAVRSEFKVVGGIVISDLISFESNRQNVIKENEVLRSEIKILTFKIERLESAAAGK